MVEEKGRTPDLRVIEELRCALERERALRADAEQARDSSHRALRAALDAIPSMVWMKDTQNNMIYVNMAAAAALGKLPEDLEGKSSYEVYPDEAAAYFVDDCEVMNSRQPKIGIVEQVLSATGEKRWVRTDKYPVTDTAGNVIGIVVSAMDVTEVVRQKDERETLMMQVARALEESQERYYLAIRGSNDGLWDWNLRTNEVFYSPRYKESLGFRDDEFPNVFKSFASHVHPQDYARVMEAVERHLKEGTPYEVEYRMRNKQGDYIWFSTRGQAIWDESGHPTRMAGSQRDITDRKQAEQNVNEFFSTVSHELRTPLAAIKGSLRLIEGGMAGRISKETQELLEIALSGCERLIRLVNDMLDLRKIEAGKLDIKRRHVSSDLLVSMVVDEVSVLAEAAGVRLTTDLGVTVTVHVDVDRIVQVLTNLVGNAIKFSPQGSTVVIQVQASDQDRVRFSVSDDGPGIPVGRQSLLFQKFQQLDQTDARRQEGTGLGLAICKAIINQHQGTIGVVSDSGKGSTFWFELEVVGDS